MNCPQVGFTIGCYIEKMNRQLLLQARCLLRRDYIVTEEAEDVLHLRVCFYPSLLYECVIQILQLVNKQSRFRRSLVKTAERAVIDVGVCSAEQLGHCRVVLKAVDVLLHVGSKDTQEVVKHGQGGDDVIISQMGVLPCETEDLQQGFELVGLQAWSHDTCHPEGIEVKRMNGKKEKSPQSLRRL